MKKKLVKCLCGNCGRMIYSHEKTWRVGLELWCTKCAGGELLYESLGD